MRFDRAIAAAAFILMITVAAGAQAFETTSIGGTNADGSAKYQDPDDTGGIPAASPSSSSPLSNFNFQVGTGADANTSTNWLSGPGSPGFGFTGSQSSSTEPATPFNTPELRQRN
jgi:hypothetical protein